MSKDMWHLKYKCYVGLESSPESYKGIFSQKVL